MPPVNPSAAVWPKSPCEHIREAGDFLWDALPSSYICGSKNPGLALLAFGLLAMAAGIAVMQWKALRA